MRRGKIALIGACVAVLLGAGSFGTSYYLASGNNKSEATQSSNTQSSEVNNSTKEVSNSTSNSEQVNTSKESTQQTSNVTNNEKQTSNVTSTTKQTSNVNSNTQTQPKQTTDNNNTNNTNTENKAETNDHSLLNHEGQKLPSNLTQTQDVYRYAYVIGALTNGANVYNAPDGSVITVLYPNSSVYVETVTNWWAKVEINSEVGYMMIKDLTYTNPNNVQMVPPNYGEGNKYQYVGTLGQLNQTSDLYSGPSTSDKVIFANVSKGEEFQVEYQEGDWYLINYGEPNLLYVPVSHVDLVGVRR